MLPVGRLGLYTLLVALPIAVEIPPDSTGGDRGNTRVTLIGGGGTFAIIDRGCENQVIATHPWEFREAAGAIEHEFANGLAIGVRGGTIEQSNEESFQISWDSTAVIRTEFNNQYIQPTIAYERDQAGFGIGWIHSREPFVFTSGSNGNWSWRPRYSQPGPSFHLRIGRRDGGRFELSYMENLPHVSAGGYVEWGIGVHPHRQLDLSVSMSRAPYDGFGLGLKFDYRVLPNWSLLGRGRFGSSGGENQSGAAFGLSYSTRPPLSPYRKPKKSRNPYDSGWRGGLEAKRPQERIPVTPAPAPAAPAPAAAAAPAAPLPAIEKYPDYEDYQPLDSLAVPLLRAEPVAPDGATGTVSVAALVDWNGNVVETRVIRSIPALDAAAIECASRWTFRPAIHRGRRLASWVTIPVRFGND